MAPSEPSPRDTWFEKVGLCRALRQRQGRPRLTSANSLLDGKGLRPELCGTSNNWERRPLLLGAGPRQSELVFQGFRLQSTVEFRGAFRSGSRPFDAAIPAGNFVRRMGMRPKHVLTPTADEAHLPTLALHQGRCFFLQKAFS